MVAIGEHDHGDGERCPGCRFREALAEFLEIAHDDGRDHWYWAIGELRQHMHAALLALDAIEAQPFADDDDDEDDAAEDAAAAITAVGAEIDHLWHALMGNGREGQGDD
ncbi:MAG: hypothetical protein ACK48S_12880 [Planctomycetia bacterium]|jgi:hypothetical protein